MQHDYAYDLALLKMSGLIQDAELERAAANGRSARPSRPGPRARTLAAIASVRAPERGTSDGSRDCLETALGAHGRAA